MENSHEYVTVVEDGFPPFNIPTNTEEEFQETLATIEYLRSHDYKFVGDWANEALFQTGAWKFLTTLSGHRVVICIADGTPFVDLHGKMQLPEPFFAPTSMKTPVWVIMYINPNDDEEWQFGLAPNGGDPDACDNYFEVVVTDVYAATSFVEQLLQVL